jgi:LacI family transcriptional regulator
MSIREIANHAKVSTATVSRVINGIPTVNRNLAKRVRKVVGEHGYSANNHARCLVSGKSGLLGLVVSDMRDPFVPGIVQSFEAAANEFGRETLVASTLHDLRRIELSIRRMAERRVEGVAVLTFGSEELILDGLRTQGITAIFVDVEPGHCNASVQIDYRRGTRQAVQHLAALKHERIAYIAGPADSKTAFAKRSAFEECMEEIALSVSSELIVAGDDTLEAGMRALTQFEQLQNRPTAVFCSTDMAAVGVMRRAHELGVAVPQELSVIGFDDIPLAGFVTPPLSSVLVPRNKLAKLALRILLCELNRFGQEIYEPKEYLLNTDLVLRHSTALASPSRSGLIDLPTITAESRTQELLPNA